MFIMNTPDPEIIETNTCDYIKVDKLFISDVIRLKEEFIKLKENIKAEILNENNINPTKFDNPN
mgnify:FL=1